MLWGIDGLFILAIILFIAGFVLIAIEMIIPGFSVPGITGIICLLIGIFLVSDSIQEGAIITIIVLTLLGIMLALILGILSKGKLKSPIILKHEQNKENGYISSSDLKYLQGKQGIALTDLRPTGSGDFDGITLDVISEGNYINKGTKLVIYKVEGSKLIVKPEN
jgi:membrane-bound ClpP family serine protease